MQIQENLGYHSYEAQFHLLSPVTPDPMLASLKSFGHCGSDVIVSLAFHAFGLYILKHIHNLERASIGLIQGKIGHAFI